MPLLGFFCLRRPSEQFFRRPPANFSQPQSLHMPWEVFFYLSGGATVVFLFHLVSHTGEVDARVGPQVEEMANAQLEAQFQSADGTRGQMNGAGIEAIVNRVQNGSMTRPSFNFSVAGPSSAGLVVGLEGSKRVVGPSSQSPSLKEDVDGGVGPASGPSYSRGKGWVAIEVNASPIEPSFLLRESPGQSQAQLTASGLSLKAQSSMCNSELEFIKMREKED